MEEKYFLRRPTTTLKCTCGGRMAVVKTLGDVEEVGCCTCGGTALVGPSASPDVPVECDPFQPKFFIEFQDFSSSERHCGRPMAIIDPGDHLQTVGCQVCGVTGNVGPNSSPDTWPPDDGS